MSLDLTHVSFTYDVGTPFERKALEDVSFSIGDGDFFGIAGDSGSGKTTLVRILKGLAKPSYGRVSVPDGCKVGLVFQYPEFQLFGQTVIDDVMFGPINMGLGEDEARRKASDALSSVGLGTQYHGRDPLALSGGEKRRVAIAGVLAMDPNVLILDEPAAGLDPFMHDMVFSLLGALNKGGRTIVLVSHSMDDIAQYCDHAVYLRNGAVASQGSPSHIFSYDPQSDGQGYLQHGHGIPKPTASCISEELRSFGFAIPNDVCTVAGLEEAILQNL